MKVALLCKSDTTGGAAVVTFRLMNALRKAGVDARMVVAEKLSDSPFVSVASTPAKRRRAFLLERLCIFIRNGFNRETIFRIDTGAEGAGVCSNPIVKEADIICLNWVNQGFVSLADIRKLGKMGKKIVWTMHDMWNMTGICHHAGSCMRYRLPDGDCSLCPLLGLSRGRKLSRDTWRRKKRLYADTPIHFVAVSRWLAALARESTLMQDADIRVIPNAFPICGDFKPHRGEPFRIVFGAARIDDPVKGHETLVEATRLLARRWPEEAARMELVTFGNMKNPEALAGIGIKHRHLGVIPPAEIAAVYSGADAVVSTSEWETLPGTLVEGQAWGCVPVALDHGGQSDIIDDGKTGRLVPWSDDREKNALGIAEGIVWALRNRADILDKMRSSVVEKFSEETVAARYLELFRSL